MIVIARVALLMALARSFQPPGGHPYYWVNKARSRRLLETRARQKAASARASGLEAQAVQWEQFADDLSREVPEYMKRSRESGYIPSELPESTRRDLKPEDLKP